MKRRQHVGKKRERVRSRRKDRRAGKFPLCGSWPRCRCVARGYVNPRERNDCGKKPAQPPRKVYSSPEHIGWG